MWRRLFLFLSYVSENDNLLYILAQLPAVTAAILKVTHYSSFLSPQQMGGSLSPGKMTGYDFQQLLIILTKPIHICQLLCSVMLLILQLEDNREFSLKHTLL